MLAMLDQSLVYTEGFICLPDLPLAIAHAWCVGDNDGLVYDPTILDATSGFEYRGIMLESGFVFETVQERGMYGVLDNHMGKWPFLRGETRGVHTNMKK